MLDPTVSRITIRRMDNMPLRLIMGLVNKEPGKIRDIDDRELETALKVFNVCFVFFKKLFTLSMKTGK